jgi:PAS domain S-box-containing protein
MGLMIVSTWHSIRVVGCGEGRRHLRLAPYGGTSVKVNDGRPAAHLDGLERRLLAFLDTSFDVLYDWHIETDYLEFNDRIDELLGHPLGTVPRSIEGWLEQIHPDDRAEAQARLDWCIMTGSPYRAEYRFRHRTGSYVLVDDRGVFLPDEAGRLTHMVGAMRDVTREREAERALRDSEELYQTLFRDTANPALRIDAQGRYLDANQAALEFLESERVDLLGNPVTEHLRIDLGDILAGDEPAVDTSSGFEVDVVVGDSLKTLLLTVTACTVGGERSFFCLGTDITERKRMQSELETSTRMLEGQARALEERNTALKVLVEQRDQGRRELEERIQANVDGRVQPTLDRLARLLGARPETALVDTMRLNLQEIARSQGLSLSRDGSTEPLTRRELEVSNLVRAGKTTDEIAGILRMSSSTVSFHRGNIRRKLGLSPGGPHLTTHLASLGYHERRE